MGLFKKSQPVDKESARLPPVEKRDSSLVTIGEESEYETIDSEDVPVEAHKPVSVPQPVSIPRENPIAKDKNDIDITIEDTEENLLAKLEAVREEKQRILEEREAKRQAELLNTPDNFPQRVYLSEADMLREILQKVDYLISIAHSKD